MRGQRNLFLHLVRTRPRLFVASAIAIAFGILLPAEVSSHPVTRWLLAWNHMRHRAQLQDDGQLVILALVVVATIASLAAIARELVVVKDMHGFTKSAHIALAGTTVLTSWAFIPCLSGCHRQPLDVVCRFVREQALELRQRARERQINLVQPRPPP